AATVSADTSGGPGTLNASTHNITVEMGPKGTTIQTGNITFTGPPPPTPVPMPGGVPEGNGQATRTPGGNASGGATHTPVS
ncbi:MAG TPA: hypothetical protein VFI22_05560, partial [Thermomicrobiales bacterium]|nr:hypothetical protein [Thermomicrobiales bacterium]